MTANSSLVDDISFMMENSGDSRYEIAIDLKKDDRFKCTRQTIKTIASYYYSIVNGGLQRNRCKLAELWVEMGYRVIVLTDFAPGPDDYYLPPEIERVMVPDYRKITSENYKERAEAFQKIIREYQVDLVVYHAWLQELMLWDEIVIKSTGCAFVASTHNIFSLPVFEGWGHYKNIIAPYLSADAVVTQNEASTEFWRNFNTNVHTVRNRLPDSIDQWNVSDCDNHEIVWVGRIAKEKNPFDLIEIMKIVKAAIPDAHLHVVGSGKDKAYFDSFISEIQKNNLEDRIIIHGFQKDVHGFYRKASVLLITSSYESYCNTLQEGLLTGLPVVMYSLPYLTLVEDNPGILQAKLNDTDSMASILIELLNDDERRKKLGRKSREFLLRHADYDYESKWREIFDISGALCLLPEKAETQMLHTFVEHYDFGVRKLKKEMADKDDMIKKQSLKIKEQTSDILGYKAVIKKYDRKLVRAALKICRFWDKAKEKAPFCF